MGPPEGAELGKVACWRSERERQVERQVETQDTEPGFSPPEFLNRSRHLESLAFCSTLEACSK